MTNMETLFIGYPPCSTCKKAYKALLDLGIEATYRNIKEENPTKEEIQSWIDRGVELKKLFNTSGMLYRELNIKEKRETYTQEQLIELLASNGMLVKRPIVIQGDMIIIGNKVSEYEKLQNRPVNDRSFFHYLKMELKFSSFCLHALDSSSCLISQIFFATYSTYIGSFSLPLYGTGVR